MSKMKTMNPQLKQFLRRNKVPDVYEALLTGLAVVCPDDPFEYLIGNLTELLRQREEDVHGLESLKWDSLVPDDMKPKKKIFGAAYLDNIYLLDEENLHPHPELYQKAYQCYNNRLVTMTFNAWFRYHLRKKAKREWLARRMKEAADYFFLRKQRVHFKIWSDWHRFRMQRQERAFDIIQRAYNISLSRLVFEAWHNVMQESRRTKEYFERLERGELDGEEDMLGPRGEARDDISLLPRRVAIKIFGYLDLVDISRCSRVCRSWKMITSNSSLWSWVDLSKAKNVVTDNVLTSLLQHYRPYVLHLNIKGCSMLTKPSFKAVGQCRNLQDLNMSECPGLNDDTMKYVAEGCSVLLYLNISFTNITDATLRLLARCCSNLQYLSLAYCKRFSDKGLQYLGTGRGGRRLVHLDLSGCPQITVNGYKNISGGCPKLQHLIINDCYTLRDDMIVAVAANCHNIRCISFLYTPNITDVALKALAVHRKLQQIRIEGNCKITDASFKLLGRYCVDLRHIYVSDCPRITDAALKSLATCRNINVLNVADCIRISDNGVRNLVEGPSGPKLREMNLTNCVRVTDVSIMKITQKCYSLVYGSFCFSEHITDAGAEMLGNMPALSSLDISGCNITDTGLGALGNCYHLRDVVLSECHQITDLGIQKFAQQCRDLDRLDISHCLQLTDQAIKNLAFCCRKLSFLNIAGCSQLSDMSIRYISGVCHYLQSLNFSGCIKVSDDSMRFLRKGLKRLRNLNMLYCHLITKPTIVKLSAKIEKVVWSDDPIPNHFGPGFDYLNALSLCKAAMEKEKEENEDKAKREQEKNEEKKEEKGDGESKGESSAEPKSSETLDLLMTSSSQEEREPQEMKRATVLMQQNDISPDS
ncbi:dynein regulatory complex subunit 6 isoform X2 [Strongylocentrotus purpuratus]|uniref:F-box domain-containing protein n=1 Tax=Strongylocentrotus purpuratus TaxID=7668 RepID=A0A7M7RE06_STRPU|nr:dynein regulatory complex subunit 6 isoform X2 [Strongylocentrotus purpuratus]